MNNSSFKISIFFFDIIHYHVARCLALQNKGGRCGYKIFNYSLRDKSPTLPISYQFLLNDKIDILSNSISVNTLKICRSLLKVLNRDNPDVVVIPGYDSWPSLTSLAWCKFNCKAAVLMSESHRLDYLRFGWKEGLKRHLVKFYDAALVGGSPHYEYAKELGLAPEFIFKGYDVVDNSFWQGKAEDVRKDQDKWRRQKNLPSSYFIASKRFIPKKNIEGLIGAYALYHFRAGEKAWPLVICGSGELEAKVKNLVDQLGLQKYIHFPGYQDAENMAIYYGLASTFVHASSHAEQWGLVVNEAMAAGLPVLVSHICGCAPDLVQDGVNGFTFDPHDVEGLARLLGKMSSGKVDLKAMGEASRRIIADWTPEVFAENLFKAVEAAQAAKRARKWWGKKT